jgi:hypothetical protein
MVDRENLLQRARYAYEVGRWRMAARILAIVVPVSILSIALTQRPAVCLALAIVLGATLVVLRWRNRQGLRVANVGLTAGILPLLAGVLISEFGSMASPVVCMSICIASGALAGAWAGFAPGGIRPGAIDWVTVAAVALVTTFLGCIDLGTNMLVAVSLSLIGSGLLAGLIQSRYVRAVP